MSRIAPVLEHVTRTYGLVPRADWPEIAARVLGDRVDTQSPSVSAEQLVGHLTIGETYLLRHPTHFDRLAEAARATVGEGRPFRLWSAGCSSGEEAWSAVIAVGQALGPVALQKVLVTGTDINPAAVDRARAGVYGAWSFREAPPWLQRDWFVAEADGRWRVVDAIRPAVSFERAPVLERARSLPEASLDVVLFRNVAIYFDAAATRAVFDEFRRILRPGALLILAPSDPRPTAGFEVDPDPSASVLRRSLPARVARTPAISRPALRTRTVPAAPAPSPAPVRSADRARTLADRGQLDAALAATPDDLDGAVLRAQIRLAQGAVEQAVAELRQVTFLAPHHRVARFWYATALEAAGQRPLARLQAGSLARHLAGGAAVLEDGLTTADELHRAVLRLKERLE